MKLTNEQMTAMRYALGLDRKRRSYRNRFHATVGSPDQELWTELVSIGAASLVQVDGATALFTVTSAGRAALAGEKPDA